VKRQGPSRHEQGMIKKLLTIALLISPLALASCVAPVVVGSGSAEETDALTGNSAGCAAPRPGPAMVEIVTPNGAHFCIDTTEVTATQYAEFLGSAEPDPEDTECWWKSTFAPGEEPADDNQQFGDPYSCHPDNTRFDPVNHPQDPVRCVDWCDAKSYCKWAGKRLCGAVAGAPTPVDHDDPDGSEWFNACSNGGLTWLPYGDDYVSGLCNDGSAQVDAQPVGQSGSCHGLLAPYSALYDMSGNVMEWDSLCRDKGSDPEAPYPICRIRGGAFIDAYTDPEIIPHRLACEPRTGGMLYDPRNMARPEIGFRCCADP
jgi:formylglycine-generating enzyme